MALARSTTHILGSIIVPPALLTGFVVVTRALRASVPEEAQLWAGVVVLIPGFLFLVRAFRFYSILIGLVYFPVVYWLTFWGSFWAAMMLYGYRE